MNSEVPRHPDQIRRRRRSLPRERNADLVALARFGDAGGKLADQGAAMELLKFGDGDAAADQRLAKLHHGRNLAAVGDGERFLQKFQISHGLPRLMCRTWLYRRGCFLAADNPEDHTIFPAPSVLQAL